MKGATPCFGCSISLTLFLMFHGLWSACGACIDGFLVPSRRVPLCPADEPVVCSTHTQTRAGQFRVSLAKAGKANPIGLVVFFFSDCVTYIPSSVLCLYQYPFYSGAGPEAFFFSAIFPPCHLGFFSCLMDFPDVPVETLILVDPLILGSHLFFFLP